MDWRVLGPLEVRANGSPINLGGRQRRLVLAILLAKADQAVSTDMLIGEVWSGMPPDSARKTVQAHVAHLRRVVNTDSDFLTSSGDGYTLSPGALAVDAARFEAAVSETQKGRSSDTGWKAARLEQALAMFRGEPYAGLADDALTVKIEAARLAELRLNSREDLLDALLAAGETTRVTADVKRMLAEHPHRERLWAIHMLALYRSGRQSEALGSFSKARQVLAEELGIEPSRELQELEQQILMHDPGLLDSLSPSQGGSRGSELRRNPYKGLRAFDEADANDFYGRGDLVRQVVDRLTARPPSRLTFVAGPSGAGKSSVVRAGVLPALRDLGLSVAVMFPGEDPGDALDQALTEALDESEAAGKDIVDVVIVDQFEEIFTSTPAERADRFIARITDTEEPTRWVATVRADFLEELLAHPALGRRLSEALVLVPPLEDHEVESAIVTPALNVGVEVEPVLVSAVVREVGTRAAALPLMQYALTDLFEHRKGAELTLDAYQRQGGLSGALVRRSEHVYQRLSPDGRDLARQVFLQLTTIADNEQFARRRVRREHLHGNDEQQLVNEILERFGAQRLLTFDQDPASGEATVELAHESLLETWPRLSRWVDEAREAILMRSRLNRALAEWEASDRDQSFLLTGGRLAQHESWTNAADLVLSPGEGEFLEESRRQEDLTRRRTRTKRNWVSAGIGTVAAVAVAFGLIAAREAATAEETERVARAENLSAAATLQLEADPELSILLALEAVGLTRGVDGTVLGVAEEALHRAVLADRLLASLDHFNEGVAHFSPDGRFFVTSGEEIGVAQVWSVNPLQWQIDLKGHTREILDAVYDPSGDRIATTSFDGTGRIWDAVTGELQLVIDPPGTFGPFIPVFSNDGSMVAASIPGGEFMIWDSVTGDGIWPEPFKGDVSGALNLEFSPDDKLLLVAQFPEPNEPVDPPPILIDVATGERFAALVGHEAEVLDVGFTPDGARILTASRDGTIKIWDEETREILDTFEGHQGPVHDLQISQSGATVASSGEVDVLVWDLATLDIKQEIVGHVGDVGGIDISPDESLLLTSSHVDSTTRLWDLSPWAHELVGFTTNESNSGRHEVFRSGVGTTPGGLAYQPDGERMWATSGSEVVTSWDTDDATAERTFQAPGPVLGVDVDDNGELLAVAGENGAKVFDLATGEEFAVGTGPIGDIAFGPGGMLTTASPAGVQVWDSHQQPSGRWISNREDASTVAISPDGTKFATGGGFGLLVFDLGGERRTIEQPLSRAPSPGTAHHQYSIVQPRWRLARVGGAATGRPSLWSTRDFERVYTLEGHTDEVNDAVFHPALPILATAGADGIVNIWDTETGTLRASIPGPGSLTDLDFSPEGRYLAALTVEGLVTVYILDIAELVAEAESRLSRWWTSKRVPPISQFPRLALPRRNI